VFPCNLKSSTYNDPENEEVKGRSEVERREAYICQLKDLMGVSYPELIAMVKNCLKNWPEKRPSVSTLLSELGSVRKKLERVHGVEHVDVMGILARKKTEELNKCIKKYKVGTLGSV